MKKGFTTGSCAAAAGKAAAYMLLSGRKKETIRIDTPAGIAYEPRIEEIRMGEEAVSCAVRKFSGDDPDVTDQALIFATVSFDDQSTQENGIRITGGEGIGIVTRPGLDQPVGSPAINSVPRQMIRKEVGEVMKLFDYHGSLQVELSVPGGEELARKTFNPRLGIEGGISVIGTTGIVEPMSTRAILDTIRVELSQSRAMGERVAVISPGNYGLDFMKAQYDYDLDRAVKCSNYIGETLDMALDQGFDAILLCGHMGKLIKVAGGIMNTHSREADCRMEIMASAAIRCGASVETLKRILDSVSTEEAYEYYRNEGIEIRCMRYLMERISFYLNKRVDGRVKTECIVYSNRYGFLGATEEAVGLLEMAKEVPI